MACLVKRKNIFYVKFRDEYGVQRLLSTELTSRRLAQKECNQIQEEINKRKKITVGRPIMGLNAILVNVIQDFETWLSQLVQREQLASSTIESQKHGFQFFKRYVSLSKADMIKKLNKQFFEGFWMWLEKQHPRRCRQGGKISEDKTRTLARGTIEQVVKVLSKFVRFIEEEYHVIIAPQEFRPKRRGRTVLRLENGEQTRQASNHLPEALSMDQVRFLIRLPFEKNIISVPEKQRKRTSKKTKEGYLQYKTAAYEMETERKHPERDSLILMTLCYTALRNSELCSLRVNNLDMQEGFIRVMGKGAKVKEIPIASELLPLLGKHIEGKKPNDYVFLTELETPFNRDGLGSLVGRYKKAFLAAYPNVKKFYPHIFRHTAITLMLEAEMPIEVVREIAGHAKIDTTMLYTHVRSPRLKKEIKKYQIGLKSDEQTGAENIGGADGDRTGKNIS